MGCRVRSRREDELGSTRDFETACQACCSCRRYNAYVKHSGAMAAEEKDEVTALCNRVIEEQDPAKFHELVVQLNELLERREHRPEQPKTKAS